MFPRIEVKSVMRAVVLLLAVNFPLAEEGAFCEKLIGFPFDSVIFHYVTKLPPRR
jgi:hypothetical protein